MSEIRVDRIQSYWEESSITFSGITTFSGTGAIGLPGGTSLQRPEVARDGQIRYINGDVKKGLEYYNGTDWITVGVANGDIPEGINPVGVFAGGQTPTVTNIIDFISISSLATNSVDFGDLSTSSARRQSAACSSSTRGVFGGGNTPTTVNTIDYITIINSGNAQDFGDLSAPAAGRWGLAACSSNTRGLFAGGSTGSFPTVTASNIIDYITIATVGNALDFGDLSSGNARSNLASCSSSTRGIFAGGQTPTLTNVIESVTIATLGNATDSTFDLSTGATRTQLASCSSSTRGIFAGGATAITPAVTVSNVIDYITIASLSNATDFGDLTVARTYLSSCSSSVRGIFAGGSTPTLSNVIDYITIATTGNALDFGDLTDGVSSNNARDMLSSCSNSHGGLLAS
jgi:hypothetical protein